MIKSIIFDLDGLLIDSEIICYQIYNKILEKYVDSKFLLEDYTQNYCGKILVKNIASLIEQFHLPISFDEGMALYKSIENEYLQKGIPLKDGAKELLVYLKENGYKISLASSSTRERALTILKDNQIDQYFDYYTFGYEVPQGKPAPDIFVKACEKINCRPEESLVLEDSEAGIQSAASAGIPVICIPDLKMPSEEMVGKTTAVLKSLYDVIEWLKNEG